MAFAKLSAALLVCERPTLTPIAGPIMVPAAASPPSTPPTPIPLGPKPVVPAIRLVEPSRLDAEAQTALAQNLRALRLPRFLGEFEKLARQCVAEGQDHYRYLLRLTELELTERKRRSFERRIKAAGFPVKKRLDEFNVSVLPSHIWGSLLGLAECAYIGRSENIVAIGNTGTGKTHLAIGLGLVACEKGLSVRFTSAAALVHELLEARREHRLARLQRKLIGYKLLIVDDLGYVSLPPEGAELLFDILSQRCERGSTLITSNLPTSEWTSVFGAAHLTDALLDRLTYKAHMLDMSGNNYRQTSDRRTA